MQNTKSDITKLISELNECKEILTAIGDDTRILILCSILSSECGGSRVAEISERTSISRPAVSRHISILKQAGIVKQRKEGKYTYYYLEPSDAGIEKLFRLISDIRRITENAPDRSENITYNKR